MVNGVLIIAIMDGFTDLFNSIFMAGLLMV